MDPTPADPAAPPPAAPCQAGVFETKSDFTKQSVAMLRRRPEFQAYMKTRDQAESFGMMLLWATLLVAMLFYVDFLFCLTEADGPRLHYFVGTAMRHAPLPVQLLLLAWAFFAGTWLIVSLWSRTYDDRREVGRLLQAHVIATSLLAFSPHPLRAAPFVAPFVSRAPLASLAPLTAFPVGYWLFYRRFGGQWRRKDVAASPYLAYSATFGGALLTCWFLAGRLLSSLPQMSLGESAVALALEADTEWQSVRGAVEAAASAGDATPVVDWLSTHGMLYQRIYAALLCFSVALVIGVLLQRLIMGSLHAVLPSRPVTWLASMLVIGAAAGYLRANGMLTSEAMGALGGVATILLLKGFEA